MVDIHGQSVFVTRYVKAISPPEGLNKAEGDLTAMVISLGSYIVFIAIVYIADTFNLWLIINQFENYRFPLIKFLDKSKVARHFFPTLLFVIRFFGIEIF